MRRSGSGRPTAGDGATAGIDRRHGRAGGRGRGRWCRIACCSSRSSAPGVRPSSASSTVAGALVGRQGVGLPAGPVEGQHQAGRAAARAADAAAVSGLELAEHLGVPARGQLAGRSAPPAPPAGARSAGRPPARPTARRRTPRAPGRAGAPAPPGTSPRAVPGRRRTRRAGLDQVGEAQGVDGGRGRRRGRSRAAACARARPGGIEPRPARGAAWTPAPAGRCPGCAGSSSPHSASTRVGTATTRPADSASSASNSRSPAPPGSVRGALRRRASSRPGRGRGSP